MSLCSESQCACVCVCVYVFTCGGGRRHHFSSCCGGWWRYERDASSTILWEGEKGREITSKGCEDNTGDMTKVLLLRLAVILYVCGGGTNHPSIHPSIQYHRISQERFVALFGLFIQKYYKKKNNGKCQHSEWIGMTKSRNNHWINIAILVCYSIIHLRRTRFDSIRFNSIIMFDFPTFRWQGEYCQGVFPTSDIECNLLNLYFVHKNNDSYFFEIVYSFDRT